MCQERESNAEYTCMHVLDKAELYWTLMGFFGLSDEEFGTLYICMPASF